VNRPIVGVVVGLAVVAVSVGLVGLMWYLPVARTWWSLSILVLGGFGGAIVGGVIAGLSLRRNRSATGS
jgi:hypothetical protein